MKNYFFLGTMLVLMTLTFMQTAVTRDGFVQSNLNSIGFTVSFAEDDDEPKYDKEKSDCEVTIEGEAGITGTWMGISYTIPVSGSITLTCGNCDIDCPAGDSYYRDDCTTKDCA